jgi:hypothetical protein
MFGGEVEEEREAKLIDFSDFAHFSRTLYAFLASPRFLSSPLGVPASSWVEMASNRAEKQQYRSICFDDNDGNRREREKSATTTTTLTALTAVHPL